MYAVAIPVAQPVAPPPQSQPTAPVVLPMEEPRFKGELGRTFQDQCVKEGLHRRFAIAPSSLMRALERMVGIAADRAGMARQYG